MEGKIAYLVDFDGTITGRDLSSELPGHFDRERFEAVEKQYRKRGIPIRRWLEENSALLPPDLQALTDLSLCWAELRPGFPEFLQSASETKAPVVVASDGFGFYIEPILKRYGLLDKISALYCNRTLISGGKIMLQTPHGHPTCRVCGNCKAYHVAGLKKDGYDVIYIGDGSNDRFGASWADLVMARDGLAAACREFNLNYRQWDTFYDIINDDLYSALGRQGRVLCDPLGDGVIQSDRGAER